jgi:hypothetical protein
MNPFLLGLAIASFVCVGIFTWKITSFLSQRGVKINYWLLRYRMIGYLRQYRQLTIEETGTTGLLFPAYIASIVLGVVCIILGVVFAQTPFF